MSEAEVMMVAQDGIWTAFTVAGPILAAALVVSVAVALLQALTQIQEATVAFVPKLVAVSVVLLLALPFMLAQLGGYAERLADLVATVN